MTMRVSTLFAAALVLAATACSSHRGGVTPAGNAAGFESADDFIAFDTPPELDRSVEPEYPEYARQHQIEGRVMLRVTVSEKGKVTDARVMESSDRMFNEPALAAVRQFHFKPARKDGQAVRSTVAIPIQFRL
jgi:protein TonB